MPERFVQDLREPRGALAENPGIIDVLIKLDRQKNKKNERSGFVFIVQSKTA